MLNRLALSFVVASSLLAATQSGETLRSPDLNQLSKKQFQQLLSKALSGPSAPIQIPKLNFVAQERRCSIPLLEWKVSHPERFSIRKLPAGRTNLDSMAIQPPAPACGGWTEGK